MKISRENLVIHAGLKSKYIAWLNGTSVAFGSIQDVQIKAMEIFNSELWQAREGHKETILKITTIGSQRFVGSRILKKWGDHGYMAS